MYAPHKPTKQEVRDWLKKEVSERRPPPSADEIRRELGWGLCTQTEPKTDIRER